MLIISLIYCLLSATEVHRVCTPVEIELKNESHGIIFEANCPIHFHLGSEKLSERFTPSKEQIKLTEEQFRIQIDSLYRFDQRLQVVRRIPKPDKEYAKHIRQYLGYVNSEGHKIILINLLNFQNYRRALKYFPNYKSEFITGFGEFYEQNTRLYQFNLGTNQLTIP